MLNQRTKILLYANNLWYFGDGMLGPLFAVFTERIGGDVFSISWAWATYLIVTGSLYVVFGQISDKIISKEKLMVLGYVLDAFFTFSYLLVSKPWHLFIIQAGIGLSVAMSTPVWYALYAKYEDKKHDGLTWGLAGGEAQFITGIAIIIGGIIVSYISFTTLFLLMGSVKVLAALYQAKILKLIPQKNRRDKSSVQN